MRRARQRVGAWIWVWAAVSALIGHAFPLAAPGVSSKVPLRLSKATLREAGMTIAAILSSKGSEVATIGADNRVSEAVASLGERRIGALPVVEGDRIVGIMSERDVIYCLRDHGAEVLDWPVSRVITAPAITAEPTTPVLSALGLMTERRIRHLPVAEGGRLIGIVSIGDLVKYRMDRIEAEANAMRSYIQSA
jgi:CBS domain-containing protein